VEATRTRTAVQAAVAAPLRAFTRRAPIPKPGFRPPPCDRISPGRTGSMSAPFYGAKAWSLPA
jgi:hypothetical protein